MKEREGEEKRGKERKTEKERKRQEEDDEAKDQGMKEVKTQTQRDPLASRSTGQTAPPPPHHQPSIQHSN